MTPVVGGGGGASRAAAERAGPGARRRSLGLSVPAPAAAAAAAAAVPYLLWPGCLPALPVAARRPSIPSRLPSCWPGAQVRLAALPRPRVLLRIFSSHGRPLRTVSAPRLPWPPGGGPGGRDDSLPIPLPPAPHLPAPRLSPGSPGQASASPSWGWPQASPSRADYTIPGVGGGGTSPSLHPAPVPATRSQAEGRDPARQRAGKVSLCGPGLLTSERCGERKAEQ